MPRKRPRPFTYRVLDGYSSYLEGTIYGYNPTAVALEVNALYSDRCPDRPGAYAIIGIKPGTIWDAPEPEPLDPASLSTADAEPPMPLSDL